MPTLYGVYRSRATRNLWLAGELGITLDHVPVIQAYRVKPGQTDLPMTTQDPAFLAISPAGAIPVLQDGDLVMSESLAINLYLARKHGGPLAPADLAEDALMMQWAMYGLTAIEPCALEIMYAMAEGRGDSAEVAAAAATLQRPLSVLETHLARRTHMIGERFSVADINMAEILRYAQAHPTLVTGFPAVNTWLKACQARPAFKVVMDRRSAEPA